MSLFIHLHVICSFFVYKLKTITVSCNTKYCATHNQLNRFVFSFLLFHRFFFSFSWTFLFCSASHLLHDYYWLINAIQFVFVLVYFSLYINFNYYLCIIISDSFMKCVENLLNRFQFFFSAVTVGKICGTIEMWCRMLLTFFCYAKKTIDEFFFFHVELVFFSLVYCIFLFFFIII